MDIRLVALNIIYKVCSNLGYSNVLLNNYIKNNTLSSLDKSFLVKLVYGTIQYKNYLKYVSDKICDETKTSLKIQIIFWMSLYQFKFLKTPLFAVSNSSVEIVKSFSQKDTGFVNYVIRNKFEEPSLFEVNIKNKKNILPLTYGFPFWLYQKISKEYSENIANKLVVDSVNIPGINFRVNTLKISQKEFEEKYKDLILQKSTIAKNNYLGNSNLINSHVFKEGLVIIQDQTSSLVSEILEPSLNSKVLDMCCAPGGKLTHISAIMQNTGQVYGCEINSNKVKLIEENIEKLGVTNVKVLNQDALNIKEKDFDFILLDAPCSGIGVIKRKPEIKFQKENSIFKDNLYSLQSSLLDKAAILLKVGGTLVYSTCTINLLENQKQILDFLNRFNNFELKYEKQFFGFENENDGFYIAKLIKN